MASHSLVTCRPWRHAEKEVYRFVTLCASGRRGAVLNLETSRAVGSPGAEFWVSSIIYSAIVSKSGVCQALMLLVFECRYIQQCVGKKMLIDDTIQALLTILCD